MSVNTLDRGKPFGSVFPPEHSAHFWQNGFYYDVHGDLVESMLDDAARARIVQMQADAEAARAAQEARSAYLQSQGVIAQPIAPTPDDGDEEPALLVGSFDFAGWLKGTMKAHFATVRSAAQTEFGMSFASKDQIIEFLVNEQKLVPSADVKI